MKTNLIIFLFLTVYGITAQPPPPGAGGGGAVVTGNIYSDAGKLTDLFSSSMSSADSMNAKLILDFYTNNGTKSNAYLQPLITTVSSATAAVAGTPVASSSVGVSGGVFSTSAIVEGLGLVLAERFKEEMTIAYLDSLLSKVEKLEANHKISKLFSSTYSTTLAVKDEVWMFKNYLNTLRESILDDLSKAPDNVVPFMREQPGLTSEDRLAIIIFDFVLQLSDGTHPLDFFSSIENTDLAGLDTNQVAYFEIIRTLSLGAKNGTSYLNKRQLSRFQNQKFTEIFLGLSMVQAEKEGKLGAQAKTKLEGFLGNIKSIYMVLDQIISMADQADAIKEKIAEGLTVENSEKLNYAIDVLDSFKSIGGQFNLLPATADSYIKIAEKIAQMKKLVDEGKYGVLVVKLSEVLVEINIETGRTTIPQKVIDFIDDYGMFFANLAQSKTGDEVKEALNAVILPVGSYRLKRENKRTISIQAYPGVGGGYEVGLQEDDLSGYAFGPVAPIGLDFSFGQKNKKNKMYRASSIFVSLIDIGTVFGYHLKTDESLEYADDFQWKHVFNPGLFYVIHTRKVVSLGLGAQYNAFSLNIDDANSLVSEQARLLQFKIFIAADIPLFTLKGSKK